MVGGESGGKGGSQDFEINLAPIIDCLTVLITFILASASFLSIGILDAGIAAAGTAAKDAKDSPPPAVSVTVELGTAKSMVVKLQGKASSTQTITAKNGEYNLDDLKENLGGIKSKWPDVNAVVLTADNGVEYRYVVKTMESIRKTIPAVMLGGF